MTDRIGTRLGVGTRVRFTDLSAFGIFDAEENVPLGTLGTVVQPTEDQENVGGIIFQILGGDIAEYESYNWIDWDNGKGGPYPSSHVDVVVD